MNRAIEHARRMLARMVGEDIVLKFRPGQSLWSCKIDPAQFDQILINLVANARDAMPNGGKLIIETANVEFAETDCKLRPDLVPGAYVMLVVSDSGVGMSDSTMEHLFEPFYTTKKREKGTGLGLATVYGIIKQNGGHIHVHSQRDLGTTFRIYFPRVMDRADAARVPLARKKPTGRETVLLVEDEMLVRKLASKILTQQGYHVIEASSGSKAWMLCEENESQIDLLVTDVVMPNMNGKELYEKLKQRQPALKALFMSGYTGDVIAQRGVLEEKTNFLPKPFTVASLAEKVREVLDR